MTKQQAQNETKQTTIKRIQWLRWVDLKIWTWQFIGDTGSIPAPFIKISTSIY